MFIAIFLSLGLQLPPGTVAPLDALALDAVVIQAVAMEAVAIEASSPDTITLSLDEAIPRALLHNPALRAQRADARAVAQDRLAATRAFLPSVRAEVQGVRTTDPVGVFGVKLRQSAFAQEDLALPALNDPSPLSGFSSSLTVELPLLAPEGLYGFSAAKHAAEAGAAGADRARQATAFLVKQAYWDAQLASLQVEVLDTARVAAACHAQQAKALHDQGLVTGLDARLAHLREAEVEVQRLSAAAEAQNALSRLAALLALPADTPLVLTDPIDAAFTGRIAPASADGPVDRADLRALRAGADAARSAHRGAWAAQLPQLFAFGTLVQHSPDSPWSGGSGDWAVGVGLRWNLFPGLGGVADVRRSEAEHAAAEARFEDAGRQVEVQILEAARFLEAAIEGLAVADRAEAESRIALDQAELRYRTGQSPVSELLDVQTATTEARLRLVTARRDVLVADAALRFARGDDDR